MTLFGRGAGAIYLHDGKARCKAVAREGVLVKDILRQVVPAIPPAARVFFGLCDLKTGYCMSHYQTLSAADCKRQYQVRVFVNSQENGFQFQKMPGKAAYNYYCSQLREDFVHGRLYPPVSVNTAVWMAAIDIAREATEKKKKFEDIIRSDRDMLRFMPMELRDRWKSDQDVQRQLKATFEKFYCVDAGADHFKGKYIEVYEKDGMCGRHIFKLKQSMAKKEHLLLLMVSSQDGISRMQRNGAQRNEAENPAESLCSFDELEALTVDIAALTVSIATVTTTEDKTPPVTLRFTNKPEMVAFAVIVHTYYQLLVDANAIILQGDLKPPEECFLVGPDDGRKADLCHAPLSHSSVRHVLERFQLEEGHFMVRESRNEDDAYTLSLCHDQKIKNFRIVRSSEDGMLSLKDPEGSEDGSSHEEGEEHLVFHTIRELIERHFHRKNGLPTYLKTNYCPKVTGRIPMYPTAHRSSSGTLSTSSGIDESQGSPAPENRIIQALKEADIKWIDYSTVEIVKHIGSGHFSNVFEAIWNSPEGKVRTAVKVPNVMQSSNVEAVLNDLKREIETMAQLQHENVVNLLGVTAASHFLSFVGEFPMVIMEFIEGGCLRGYLERIKRGLNQRTVLEQKPVLLQFSMQIAEGMQYLEEAKVVHRDLATRNVLVVNEKQVKISDFGLARLRFEDKDYYQGKDKKDLPIYWYAPECLMSLKFTHKSDVWSFGATLWEIFTFGELPTTILQRNIAGKTISEAFQALARFFQQGQRLPHRPVCPPEVYDIMKECWDIDPARRPTFSDLTTKIALVKTRII